MAEDIKLFELTEENPEMARKFYEAIVDTIKGDKENINKMLDIFISKLDREEKIKLKACIEGKDPSEIKANLNKKGKFCSNCGKKVEGGNFCTGCGKALK